MHVLLELELCAVGRLYFLKCITLLHFVLPCPGWRLDEGSCQKQHQRPATIRLDGLPSPRLGTCDDVDVINVHGKRDDPAEIGTPGH